MEQRDDADLLHRYASERDEQAFAELVTRHVNGVYSAALRRVGGDVQLAEDVTQQVFVALARQSRTVERHPVLSAWLYVTTRHQAANVVRAEQRRKAREEEAQAMETNRPETTHDVDWARVAPVLDEVIDQLGEADRRAVLLRFVDQRNFADMGTVLGVSEDAARMRVERALQKLRSLLTRRGIPSTGAALGVALANQIVVAAPTGLAASIAGGAALAGPATGPVVLLLQFMTATKTVIGATGLLIVISAGIATRETMRWRTADAAFVQATQENERLARQNRTERARATALDQQVQELQATAADLAAGKGASDSSHALARAAAPEPRPGAASTLSRAESTAAGRRFVASHPEVKAAAMEYYRGVMRETFGAFYRQRGFSEAEIEAFEASMTAGAGTFRMITDENGQRIPISTPTFGDEAKRAEENERLATLLGTDGVKALRQYLQGVPARKLTAQLAGALSFTSSPLSAEQADQFAAVASEVSASAKPTNGRYNWDAVIARSQDILSPAQREALLALQARDEFDMALSRAMQRGPSENTNQASIGRN